MTLVARSACKKSVNQFYHLTKLTKSSKMYLCSSKLNVHSLSVCSQILLLVGNTILPSHETETVKRLCARVKLRHFRNCTHYVLLFKESVDSGG